MTPLLDALLEAAYQQGYRRFFCGAARGFDLLAAERTAAMQKRHPDARLVLVIPYTRQAAAWQEADVHRYERVLCHSDDTRVLSGRYYRGCLHVRNRYMVDRAALCIAYLDKPAGGTMSTVKEALKKQLTVVNLALPDTVAAFIGKGCVTPRA